MNKLIVINIPFVLALLAFTLLSFFSALYGFPELDEGFFIQIAKSTAGGALLYNDIPGMYGPIFFKFNEIIFANFGFLHFTSRVATFILGFGTFILTYLTIRKGTNEGGPYIIAYSGIWFLSSSSRFSESLHPGWYISILIVLMSYLILSDLKSKYLSLGLLSGLLIGIKIHIGVLAILGISQIIFVSSQSKLAQKLKFIPTFLLFIIILLMMQTEILKLSVINLLPYLFVLVIFAHITRSKISLERNETNFFTQYYFSVLVASFSIYIWASYHFGFANLKHDMLDVPRLWFPRFYGENLVLPWEIKIFISMLYCTTIYGVIFNGRTLINFILFIFSLGLLIPNILAPHFFIVIHACLLFKFIKEGGEKFVPLLLLSLLQIFHMFPISGTQVFYASPICWILTGIATVKDKRNFENKFYYLKLVLIYIILVFTLPFVQTILKGESFYILSSKLNQNEHIIVGNDQGKEIINLVNYLKPKLSSESTVLTIPRYDSVNLFLDINPPINKDLYYFSDLTVEELNNIGARLFNSDYVILFPINTRATNVLSSELLINTIFRYQELVKDYKSTEEGEGLGSYQLQILQKK